MAFPSPFPATDQSWLSHPSKVPLGTSQGTFPRFTKLQTSLPIISKVLPGLDFLCSFRVGTLFPFRPGILSPVPTQGPGFWPVDALL